jgi:hypothetical protein
MLAVERVSVLLEVCYVGLQGDMKCFNVLSEWATRKTTTTVARREVYGSGTANTAVVLDEGAIAAQTSSTAIEHGRVSKVVGVGEPVPVLEVLLVTHPQQLPQMLLTGW